MKRSHVAVALTIVAIVASAVVFSTSGRAGMSDQERTVWGSVAALGFAVAVISIAIAGRRGK